jgi:eukaryotic-like serine/threonine-protein kinase
MTWLPDQAISRLRAVATWPEFAHARYTVIEEIGRGGMGIVYLARDESLGREVAIKVSNAVGSPALERRLQIEARVLARLEHPGIVPIHEVGRLADDRLYYVMKRVRGETLLEHVRARPSIPDLLRVFERICEPVAFAHAHGCIHRDLKPGNIMVGAFGEVMVMDWGVAKVAPRSASGPREESESSTREADSGPEPSARPFVDDTVHTDAGTVLGTPGFMPPEQATGRAAEVDERADVYGLGAILFMLLTGAPPPATAEAAVAAVERDTTVPRLLRAICARALAPSPADRYQTVRSLAADVARYRAGQAVDAHRETILERTTRFARTYRTPILLVLAYMIMRAIVAVVAGR